MEPPSKTRVRDAALEALLQEAARLRASAEETRAGAVHAESRAENDKDTRGLEASYLARGQAQRVIETEDAVKRLRFLDLKPFDEQEGIALAALVQLEVDGAPGRWYFVAPVAGGLQLAVAGAVVHLITPSAPIGRALLGKRVGDVFELRIAGGLREYEVVAVR